MSYNDYEPVIGLEIHAQLKTESKLFCSCSAAFGGDDNENTCPVCTSQPGALPVLNKKAIEYGIKTGIALNCEVRAYSVFARKQYFYPDLPSGYQISQYDQPICENGFVEFILNDERRRIGVTRAHLEQDAGKSIHAGEHSLINLNRAGVPLMEIVSEPEIRSAAEAAEYARTIRQILRYLDVCDGNLEEGSLRCDCNVSVRKKGSSQLGRRVEIKNINSFRFVEKAIDFEIHRQIDALEAGESIQQETRLYDPDKNRTFIMRTKEEAQDYRYFPDPDLLPLRLTSQRIEEVKSGMPELPLVRAQRFIDEYQLPEYDAFLLTSEKPLSDYFETVAKVSGHPKSASNWMMSELIRELNDHKKEVTDSPVSAESLGKLILEINKGTISGKIGKTVFVEMWNSGKDPQAIIQEKGLMQITDSSAIEKFVDEAIAANPNQVAEYRSGKEKVFGFFVGQVMKTSKGQASPELVNDLLKQKLKG